MTDPWSELAQVRLCTRPVGATSDEHKRYLDKEVLSLESALARAKQLRNLENPFVSLPEEILLLIMLFRRDIALRVAKLRPQIDWKQKSQYQPWTTIAYVCRRLRYISRCPQLNSDVSDLALPPKLIEHVLSQSASMPLTVSLSDRASGKRHASAGVLRYIKNNRNRVDSLSLSGMYATDNLALQLIGRLKLFSHLKHLSIHGYRTTPFQRGSSLKNFIVPVDLTDRPLSDWRPPPALESLHLTMTPFPWDSSIYDNLTKLTLSRLRMYVHDVCNLLRRLQSTGRLEHLIFDCVDLEYGIELEPEDMWEDEDEDEEEVLRRLEREGLDWVTRDFHAPSSLKTWIAIMPESTDNPLPAFMRPSESVSYALQVKDSPACWENELKGFLGKHLPDPREHGGATGDERLAPVVAVHFSIQPFVVHGEKVLQATTQLYRHLDTRTAAITLQFTVDKLYKLPHYILGEFSDVDTEDEPAEPYFDEVRELSLESAVTYTWDEWAEVLKLFPSLTTLKLSEDVLPNVLPAVERVNAAAESESEVHLDIQSLHVIRSQKYGYSSSTFTVNLLLDWLAIRKERGSPLAELRVPPALAAQMDEHFGEEDFESEEESSSVGWRSLLDG